MDTHLFEEVMGISVSGKKEIVENRRSSLALSDGNSSELVTDLDDEDKYPYNIPFESKFRPDEMRCLALLAHNNMKPAMKNFVLSHREVLRKFRLTGTFTTMTMLKTIFGDDPEMMYGPTCQSGPLGGDAEICTLMCLEDLGGMIFFVDPLSAHPHQADIDSLFRLANVYNIIAAPNPTSAHSLCFVLKTSLEEGRKDKIPSFFHTLQSPGVNLYKKEQKREAERNTFKKPLLKTRISFKEQMEKKSK
uniref:MGS-like domain-containing protein n=1 Tax=Pseudictyota dubia TaxID=2749911 RepID=A0A7R9VS37_9STRA